MMFSVVPVNSLHHIDQNKVNHDFFNHVIPLVPELLSSDTNCIINGVILVIR